MFCDICGDNWGQDSVPLTETIPVKVGLANGAFRSNAVWSILSSMLAFLDHLNHSDVFTCKGATAKIRFKKLSSDSISPVPGALFITCCFNAKLLTTSVLV